jgi:predicted nucleic acid-binding protein
MTLVVDASIAVAWCFEDERSPETDAALEFVGKEGAVVPALWRLEVANGFRSAIRRGRTDRTYRDTALERLSMLAIETDAETVKHAWSATLALADKHGLTPYDAAYLELAQRRRVPLATLDLDLRSAAANEGVAIFAGPK